MVDYGRRIIRAQRPGWEGTYLNYKALKKILFKLEDAVIGDLDDDEEYEQRTSLVSTSSNEDDIETLKTKFFTELRKEIEKMSLFSLKVQGQLAEAVGSMGFDSVKQFDSRSSLFKAMGNNSQIDSYAVLGVELVHLLRYICINAVGIKKILDKYKLVFEQLDEPAKYDLGSNHVQQLANSQSILAIQSSLQSALSEGYRQQDASEDANALSYFRFECVMECSETVQRNAEVLQVPFIDFSNPQSAIANGTMFGGSDGGVQALKWLLNLHPDDLLKMDQKQLQRMWNRWSGGQEVQPTDQDRVLSVPRRGLQTIQEDDEDEEEDVEAPVEEKQRPIWYWGGASKASMMLNVLSILLYTINYYVVAPTANHYAIQLGIDGAYGSSLIGASSLAALFSAFVFSMWYIQSTFKSALIFSAACPLLGNLLYGLAISFESMQMALLGRFLCGFGSAEVLNRQMIAACVHYERMRKASAFFVAAGVIGLSAGPLLAAVLDVVSGRDMEVDLELPLLPAGGIIYNNVTAPGFVMAALWLVQLVGLLVLFEEPVRVNSTSSMEDSSIDDSDDFDDSLATKSRDGSYGSINSTDDTLLAESPRQAYQGLVEEAKASWALVFSSRGLPVGLLVFCYIEMTDEVVITSCSMIIHRYFGWHGYVAGFLIAAWAAFVVPAQLAVDKLSQHFSERRILFRGIVSILICLLGLLNYSGFVFDAVGATTMNDSSMHHIEKMSIGDEKVKDLLTDDGEFVYDWGLGKFFYLTFLSLMFLGTTVLEGVDTSIISKVATPKLNDRFFNSGLLATILGTIGRVVGDLLITLSALLDLNIFVDFVNAVFLPVMLFTIAMLYYVNRFYRKLL